MIQLLSIVVSSFLLAAHASTHQFPLPVTYDTIIQSPIDPNITISYKQPSPGTCATAFDTQQQYSGYVNLPPFTLAPFQQNYSINTFFWFFESRVHPETAPLTIWLNGGPGSSSMVGLFQEMGPCELVRLPNGTYATQPRLWGWDRSSNLLFIDQPTQTGFSFDERVNASVDLGKDYPFMLESREDVQDLPSDAPAWRFLNGTFASGRWVNTQNSTAIAARACWHFLQGFLSAFPQYNPGTRPNTTVIEPSGVNLFLESYGGLYGPTFADFFEDQNDRRRNGLLSGSSLEIRLDSVGIVNGILDTLTASISVANFTRSNTYGIAAIDLVTYQNTMSAINSDGGCRALVSRCRSISSVADPEGICSDALDACNRAGFIVYDKANKSPYDIRFSPRFGPGGAIQEYLNDANVMQAIGAQVNFTQTSMAVFQAFSESGDAIRGTQLASLAELLTRGIRIAFIYGDADIICNWYGGQNASLELARLLPSYSNFPGAGYADVIVNTSYVGGHVRQYGNLSFSRIFDAGHLVPMYQPETAFTVFSRIIQGDAISTGHNIDLSIYKSEGLADSLSRTNKATMEPALFCWIRDTLNTCTQEERRAINRGQGIVNNGIWSPLAVAAPDSSSRVSSQSRVSKTAATTSSVQLTGVFTATTLPTPTSGASRNSAPFRLSRRALVQTDEDRDEEDRKSARRRQRGLIGGLGATGGILLSVLAAWLTRHCCTRHRKKDSEPDEEKPPTTVTRLVETPPVQPRRPSKMESIPEQSPRPSEDIKQPILSTHPNSPIPFYEEQPQSRRPTTLADVEPIVDEQTAIPVQRSVVPDEPQSVAAREPDDADVIVPIQRSVVPDEPDNFVVRTPPPNELTPPPTPPLESTPLRELTPIREPTPPALKPTPPPLEPTPSLLEPTPPLLEPTPPLLEPTPPPPEPTPPPPEPTPPPPEPTPPKTPTPPREIIPPVSVQRSVSLPPPEPEDPAAIPLPQEDPADIALPQEVPADIPLPQEDPAAIPLPESRKPSLVSRIIDRIAE